MEQTEETKERFDGLYHKTIPLILFAPTEDSKKFTKALSSLFCSLDNISVFNEVYASLSSSINGRPQYDHHQETLISSFMEQYTSLNQRLRNIEGTYLEFKGMIDRINKDHRNLINQGKTIYVLGRKVMVLLKHDECILHKDEKNTHRQIKSTIISNAEIPVVSKKSSAKKNKTGTPIICPECKYNWLHNIKGRYATCPKCKKHIVFDKKVI